MNKTALLLIDIQNDYFPNGIMELSGAVEAAENSAKVLKLFRKKKFPVLHIQHESISEGSFFFLPETEGQKINEIVKPVDNEKIIVKNYPNSFLKTSLLEDLKNKNITKLIITGMMSFMCVDATTRAAKDLGFECTLIHDATAARGLSFNGIDVPAEHVQASMISALAFICDSVVDTTTFLNVY